MKSPAFFLSMQNCPFASVMHPATMEESGRERSETVANSIGCPFSSVTLPIRFCALSWHIVANKIMIHVVTLFMIDKFYIRLFDAMKSCLVARSRILMSQ